MKNVTDASFGKYGRVLDEYDTAGIVKEMKHTPMPKDVLYVPSVEELEQLKIAEDFKNKGFGGLEVQVGYCNGHNEDKEAIEYHRCSEINVAATDLILWLGSQQDMEDGAYDFDKLEPFFVPLGTAIEVYATTLHYAPCSHEREGFRCVVVLPKGTNEEIDFSFNKEGEMKLLTAKNKWLIENQEERR